MQLSITLFHHFAICLGRILRTDQSVLCYVQARVTILNCTVKGHVNFCKLTLKLTPSRRR
ncbi:hypothetical protein V6Z12_A10G213500 [Gossypium hirsutum]